MSDPIDLWTINARLGFAADYGKDPTAVEEAIHNHRVLFSLIRDLGAEEAALELRAVETARKIKSNPLLFLFNICRRRSLQKAVLGMQGMEWHGDESRFNP
jgi:hypothetical protein